MGNKKEPSEKHIKQAQWDQQDPRGTPIKL